jgi:hypothetical protein
MKETLEPHIRNFIVDIQTADYPRDMFAMVYNSLKKMGALMAPVHISHGRRNVQTEKEIFNAFHANPSSNTRQDAFETGVFQITVCPILHEEQFWFSCVTVKRATTLDSNLCLQFWRLFLQIHCR